MKKLITVFVLMFTVLSASANSYAFLADDDARQAVYGALDKAIPALKSAPFGNRTIAILPMKAGHSILAGRLKNMLVQSGFVCVEGKEDPMWDEILKEIEWDERKDDILDPATVVKFGKLKAAHILMQCEIRVIHRNSERIYAEIELRATDIATKRVIWGGTFANRFYFSKKVRGITGLDVELCELLRKNFKKAHKSLTAPVTAAKFNNIKTVTVVPLSGDIDSYITGLAKAMVTRTNLMPQDPHIPSLAEVRTAARDGLFNSDAILYGSVRALHKTDPTQYTQGKKVVTAWEVIAEIEISIEEAKTGNILWSEPVLVKETLTSERDMTPEELKNYREGKFNTIPDEIKEDIGDNWKSYLKVIGIIIGAVILLIAAVSVIKAFISYNSVR